MIKNLRLLQINPKGLVPIFEILMEYMRKVQGETIPQAGRKYAFTDIEDGAMGLSQSLECVDFLNSVGTFNNKSHQTLVPDESYIDEVENMNRSVCSIFCSILMKSLREEQKEAYHFRERRRIR